MFRIDSDGATNDNQFTEGNPQTNTPATVVSAEWLNAVQEELAAVIEGASIVLDKPTDTQLLAALRVIINQQSYFLKVGKLEWFDDYFAPSATFPYLCLTDADATLTTTNWPDLVPYLRAKKLRYKANLSGAKTAFDVTNFARSSGTVTLTLANTAAEIAFVKALAEDNLVHGSFTNWRTITTSALISDLPVGDYAITAIDATNRTISLTHAGSNGSTAVTATIECYPHRIAGQTTQARHFQVGGRSLVTVNDADYEIIGSLRRRDRLQGHYHYVKSTSYSNTDLFLFDGQRGGPTIAGGSANGGTPNANHFHAKDLYDDGTNGTPRTGKTTDPRGFGAFLYMWGQRYVP